MSVDDTENEHLQSITPVQQMLASCTGAAITSLLVTPLDVVKIRLQSQQKPIGPGSAFIYNNGLMDHVCICSHCAENGNGAGMRKRKPWYRRPGHFTPGRTLQCERGALTCANPEMFKVCSGQMTGTMDVMVQIVRTEGITSLWSGLPPTLVMAIPATVLYFTTYDQLKYAWGYNEQDPSTKYIPVVAGSAARSLTTTVISPIELIRTKMQSQQLGYRELAKAVRITTNECGLGMLLRGLGPTLLRDVPFSGMYWFGYEYLKAMQLRDSGRKVPTFPEAFIAGAASGTVAAIITLPFDVIKTHRQIELGKIEFCKDKKVTSTWKMIAQLYKQKGPSALFAGIVPRILKVSPACAIMISSYEYGKKFFRNHNNKVKKEWD
jgi:solute carrier family 25 protein 39/40